MEVIPYFTVKDLEDSVGSRPQFQGRSSSFVLSQTGASTSRGLLFVGTLPHTIIGLITRSIVRQFRPSQTSQGKYELVPSTKVFYISTSHVFSQGRYRLDPDRDYWFLRLEKPFERVVRELLETWTRRVLSDFVVSVYLT